MSEHYGEERVVDVRSSELSPDERRELEAWRSGRMTQGVRRPGLSPGAVVLWSLAVGLLLLIAAGTLSMLLVIGTLLNTLGAASNVGGAAGAAIAEAGRSLSGVARDLRNLVDPTHPPTGSITYDTEIEALSRYREGSVLGQSQEYTFTFIDVRRRDDGASPELTYYAVIRRAYTQPRETKALGVTIRVDRGEQEHYLYKGQSFRLGQRFYRVNWVSWQDRELAVAVYRNGDQVIGPVALAYD